MTPAEISAAAARIVERTCREQDQPVTVTDPAILSAVATILSGRRRERRAS